MPSMIKDAYRESISVGFSGVSLCTVLEGRRGVELIRIGMDKWAVLGVELIRIGPNKWAECWV